MKKIDEDAAKDLMSRNPKHWSLAFQSTTSKCDIVDNNMCEAFNSILVNARQKSIITMLEEIRIFVMEKIVEKREFVNKWNNNYGPHIKDGFDEYKKEGVDWRVHWNGDRGCEVKKGRRQFTINLNKKECSCRPLGERKSPGRPKQARRKSKGEASKKLGYISRVGNINTCSICGQQGHNTRGCSGRASIPTTKVSLKETTTASVHTSNAKDNNQVEYNVQRKRKPSLKGYGLYTNLKTGQQTFYGFLGKGVQLGEPSSKNKDPIGKRKAHSGSVGTQQSQKRMKK
ncbi:hypothetical protein PTKIN_Ptkin02bG0241900 [Pterospermum kingtungense]